MVWSRFLQIKWLWQATASISFLLKYWIFSFLGLRRLIIKSKLAVVGQPVYNLTIFGYLFTYFQDNLGHGITWCWCSLELKRLLVIAVSSCSGVIQFDNWSSANVLSWVSAIPKSTLLMSLDNRETVGSSTLLDENGESG